MRSIVTRAGVAALACASVLTFAVHADAAQRGGYARSSTVSHTTFAPRSAAVSPFQPCTIFMARSHVPARGDGRRRLRRAGHFGAQADAQVLEMESVQG